MNLSNVSVSENGGRYTCTVRNLAGIETVTRTVNFLPQFIEEPSDVVADVNESVILSVVAEGFPYPNFQWQRLTNGEFMNLDEENTTTLEFEPIKYSDAGIYRCVISSIVNNTEQKIFSRNATVSGMFKYCSSFLYVMLTGIN